MPPKCSGRQKGKLYLWKSGGGGRTDSAAIQSTAFHIVKTLCRHPAEWGPAPHFWVIPQSPHSGLRYAGKRGFPEAGDSVRLGSIVVLYISDFISYKINAAVLSLSFFVLFCFKSSANSGLCYWCLSVVCLAALCVCSSRNMPGNVCWTYLGGHFGVAFSAQFIGTRRNCLHNPSVSCVFFSDTAVITLL